MTYKDKIEWQLREEYGKVTYSYTCHWKHIDRLCKISNNCKTAEIIFTAITATGVLSTLCFSAKWLTIITAVIATISLGITLYCKGSNSDEMIIKHRKTADDLLEIRENYISLLTDLDRLDESTIVEKRDMLIKEVADIYRVALPTNQKDYEEAQQELKEKEYQFFSDEEIDMMLPKHLRKN